MTRSEITESVETTLPPLCQTFVAGLLLAGFYNLVSGLLEHTARRVAPARGSEEESDRARATAREEIIFNFMSGLILFFERPIKVGDVVTVGDTMGTVEKINIRSTSVLSYDRQVLIIPNAVRRVEPRTPAPRLHGCRRPIPGDIGAQSRDQPAVRRTRDRHPVPPANVAHQRSASSTPGPVETGPRRDRSPPTPNREMRTDPCRTSISRSH